MGLWSERCDMELSRAEWLNIIPLLAAAILALVGWIVTYFHRWHFDNKANQLARVNRQLKELYGPLYVRLLASDEAWRCFWQKHRPQHGQASYFGPGLDVSEQEKQVWRHWMTHVFEPLNAKTEALLLNNIDLIDSSDIPEPYVQALAHIAAYKAVLANWQQHDYSTHVSVNNWPHQALLDLVKPEYEKLKRQQQQLINIISKT